MKVGLLFNGPKATGGQDLYSTYQVTVQTSAKTPDIRGWRQAIARRLHYPTICKVHRAFLGKPGRWAERQDTISSFSGLTNSS